MNLISTSLMAVLLRSKQQTLRRDHEDRLRRAGYRDGERRPRIHRHWTNR